MLRSGERVAVAHSYQEFYFNYQISYASFSPHSLCILFSFSTGLGDANGLSESAASDALKAIYGSTKDKAPEV